MRLDRLVWTRLAPGLTQHEEHDVAVSLAPRANESVSFFLIDNDEFREGAPSIPVCDVFILVRRAGHQRVAMLFVELKGSQRNSDRAEEQLQSAISRIDHELATGCRVESTRHRRAVIVLGQFGLPRDSADRSARFFRQTGVPLFWVQNVRFHEPHDLRKYLPADWT